MKDNVLRIIAQAMSSVDFAHKDGQRFKPARRQLKMEDLRQHLAGEEVVACYLIEPGSDKTRLAVLDFDDHGKVVEWDEMVETARKVVKRFNKLQIYPFVERSSGGRGIHLWILFTEPVLASRVRAFVGEVLVSCKLAVGDKGVIDGHVEVFPKQDSVAADGLGNHITLPFSGQSVALDPKTFEVSEDVAPVINGAGPVVAAVAKTKASSGSGDARNLVFNESDIAAALEFVPGDTRERRVFVGMCIRNSASDAGYLDDQAFALWAAWVKIHESEYTDKKARDRWKTFKGKVGEKRRTIASLFKVAKDAGWEGPTGDGIIVMRPGELRSILEKAETALFDSGLPIFQRGSELVMPNKSQSACGVTRDPEATSLFSINAEWLVQLMAQACRWGRYNAKGDIVPADPAIRYATALLAQPPGKWRFPKLRTVINTPTLDRKGEILDKPGYHKGTELLLDFEPGLFPPIPEKPSREQAVEALEVLNRTLRGFPFDGEDEGPVSPSRSVALSAMLTALVRPALRTAPMHGFDAPTPGTGKSVLSEAAAILAQGTSPAHMTQGKSPEEDEKRLSTVLHAGDPVIVFDNCQYQITGDFLCSMLTQERVQARILGQSERRILPSTSLVICNGNNLTFAGDISRRSVRCVTDAKEERPERRKFDWDFHDELRAQRPALVVAGLTVLRAYVVAGRPGSKQLSAMGSFEDWSWIRGALVWLGHADPADSREQILEIDPRRAELSQVLQFWDEAFGTSKVALATLGQVNGQDSPRLVLKNALMEASNKPIWNAKSVGWWLRKNTRRIVGGRCIVPSTERGGQVLWQLLSESKQSVMTVGEPAIEEIPF